MAAIALYHFYSSLMYFTVADMYLLAGPRPRPDMQNPVCKVAYQFPILSYQLRFCSLNTYIYPCS